jgi:hypothetical protein
MTNHLRSCFPIVAALRLTACAAADPHDAADPEAAELAQVAPQPHRGVCGGGTWGCLARVRTDERDAIRPFATPQGLGPADLAAAYRLAPRRAAPATIALVVAYHYESAERDLATYRAQFGLPPCTAASGCFRRVNQDGRAAPLPARPPADDDWTVEAALDLQLASAACPTCALVLVEANDDRGDGLFAAQRGAIAAGATVISNSWGGPEAGREAALEAFFDHPGVGTFVATGDAGYDDGGRGADYPGTSAHVTGVGGTRLVKSAVSPRGWTEGAWTQGGSGCSASIARPAWQRQRACARRASSDVAAVGDPSTGLAVYHQASGGWIVVGGTSAASPFVAGVYARYGLGAEPPSFAYAHPAQYFDITAGANGGCAGALCKAGAGWDGPTGVGAPDGAALGAAP